MSAVYRDRRDGALQRTGPSYAGPGVRAVNRPAGARRRRPPGLAVARLALGPGQARGTVTQAGTRAGRGQWARAGPWDCHCLPVRTS